MESHAVHVILLLAVTHLQPSPATVPKHPTASITLKHSSGIFPGFQDLSFSQELSRLEGDPANVRGGGVKLLNLFGSFQSKTFYDYMILLP